MDRPPTADVVGGRRQTDHLDVNSGHKEASHLPDGLGWFTNTAHPKADIADWCREYPGLRVEVGPPMVSAATHTAKQMKAKRPPIVGLYVTAWPSR